MSKLDQPAVEPERLMQAWQETLPTVLHPGDTANVQLDEANPRVFRIHIDTVGRTGYSFDFSCVYKDSRELTVGLVDVEKDNQSVDEHTEVIQELAEDYVRHIHECAQALHELTHG
jgi:hypothetical protein